MNPTPRKLSLSLSLSRALSRALTTATAAASQSGSAFPLKTVTTKNFEASLSELRDHVRTSDFVAIDLEMTGVTSAPWRESFEFDRSDVRYLKVRDSAHKFAVIQFGVCPFRWDSSNHYFIAYPYNFYVFPRQEVEDLAPCYEFLCQTTSMDFLAKYQFDFNACIREGISYLSRAQEREAVRRLNSRYESEHSNIYKLKDVKDIQLISMADILFSERMKNKFSKWRDGLLQEQSREEQIIGTSKDSKQLFEVIFFKMHPAIRLSGFTSRQLKLIQLVIRKHFQDLSYVCVNSEDSGSQHMVVYTDSKDELNLLLKEVKDGNRKAEEKKIQNAVGFRHVIDLLSAEKKLIVGHNCFLDIAHVYNKFIGPLPGTPEEFVTSINKYFPHIVDTKILFNNNHVLQEKMKRSRKSLASAFSLFCPQIAVGSNSSDLDSPLHVKVNVEVNDLRSSSWNPGAKHEAGYDAFMTGCIFAQICSDLGVDYKHHESSPQQLALNEKLQKYVNHLYLSWIHGDIIDLNTGDKVAESTPSNNLKRQYPKILFENIVIIWGFPSQLKANDLRVCISKVFGPASVVSVYHLDATAVFVQFSKTELVYDFLLLKDTLERSDGAILVLHPLAKILEGGNTCAADYDTYKEICGSPISEALFAKQAKAVGIKWKTKLVESQVTLQTEDHESPGAEGSVNSVMKFVKTKPNIIEQLRNAPSHRKVSSFETEDSCCAVEMNA
ncbi:poly(A)-specific ribonuclease PARN isoform X1 [Arachis stenosperma]|uniref:poly(A)-specific ribonuclease PARN isoform X1 n=1 Tax=Arachis stenosperma TaxID=217475 RepID=UPI0025AC9D38|nr:poly(A)-specific ribonuclease PARN isoform X1 [Arachis stenosperma]